MAVQAQYPSNAFSPDFRTRMQNNLLDELQMLQGRDDHHHHHHIGALNHGASPLIINNHNNNDTVFSNPQSELTCIPSGSNKRMREEYSSSVMAAAHTHTPVAFAYQNPDQTRLIESAGTSTSGRTCSSSSSPIAQDLVAHLCNQSLEIDVMIRLQNERLRLGLEQAQKRHCRALISSLEQQVLRKLKEKETELENASRSNAELEEKIRQMSAENQIWFNVAKNNEAIVASLRTSLEQVLLQNTVNNAVQAKEGYGDSDGAAFPADDAQSGCFEEGDEERTTNGAVEKKTAAFATECCRRKCKVCGEKDVSVLLLPCRHLCLCKDCDSQTDMCPICHVTKNACLQIFMS